MDDARHPDEIAELERRHEEIRNRLKDDGKDEVADAFLQALAESKAVIARPLGDLERLSGSELELLSTYYRQIDAGARIPDASIWDRRRRIAEASVFPGYLNNIHFASLTLDERGLPNYGCCCFMLGGGVRGEPGIARSRGEHQSLLRGEDVMESALSTHDEITRRLRAEHERLLKLRKRLRTLLRDYEHRAAGRTVYYAVDWSELYLFLIGGAGEVDVGFQADQAERDVLVRLSLNHLFSTLCDKLYLLPPHASEMWSFIRGVRQRLRSHETLFELAKGAFEQLPPNARKVLESLESGADEISQSELDAVIGLVKGEFKELCDHVMKLRALLDRDILGQLGRLLRERKLSYSVELLIESLGGSSEDLEISTDEIDNVSDAIPSSKRLRLSKRRDAHALLQLRSINRLAAPRDAYIVLVTRDQSIRDAATTLAQETWFGWPSVREHFRHVETIYLDLALRGTSSRDDALRWITEVDERVGKLDQLVTTLLDRPASPSRSMPTLITDVTALLGESRQVWHEHVNLRLSLADANVPWQIEAAEPASVSDREGAGLREPAARISEHSGGQRRRRADRAAQGCARPRAP